MRRLATTSDEVRPGRARRWTAAGRAMILGVASLLMLTACATPSRTEEVLPSRFVENPTITPAAQNEFGAGARQAYDEITEWSMAQWLREPLLDPQAQDPVNAQLLSVGIVDRMVPVTAQHWQELTAAAVNGDEEARDTVQLLRFHVWQETQLQTPGGSPIESQAISQGTVDLAPQWASGTQPLTISFEQTARITLMNRRDPYPATVTKEITFEVVPAEVVAFDAPTDMPTNDLYTPTPTSTTPTATATAGPTPSIGTLTNTVGEHNPDAQWFIATFGGESELHFDQAATEQPYSTASETVTVEPTEGLIPAPAATDE